MSEEVIKFTSPRRQVKEDFKLIDTQETAGLKIKWFGKFTKNREKIMLCWKFFPGDKLQKGINFVGHIKAYPHPTYNDFEPFEFDFNVNGAEQETKETREYEYLTKRDWFCATYECELTRSCENMFVNPLPPANPQVAQEIPILDSVIPYDKMFAPSSQHDAVLLVEGKKLHVNKAFLSYHSMYFSDLFSGNIDGENGIRIEDVTYKKFGLLMSTIYPDTVLPDYKYTDTLLELGNRFKMPAVMRHFENLYLHESKLTNEQLIVLADKHGLTKLLEKTIREINTLAEAKKLNESAEFSQLSDLAKVKILDRLMLVISLL